MTKKGREFNEIYDLTAMRVIVDSVKDCYGAIGIIHSLWKPLPGRFKDYVAMPKFNLYQALHTTVIGPEGRPLEIQIRTRQMHYTAEYGVAAHWIYKERAARPQAGDPARGGWARRGRSRGRRRWTATVDGDRRDRQAGVAAAPARLAAGAPGPPRVHGDAQDRPVRGRGLRVHAEGRGEVLAAGATPLDFAYAVHTDVGHRCVGAKVNGKITPLHYRLQSGDIVEILTSSRSAARRATGSRW